VPDTHVATRAFAIILAQALLFAIAPLARAESLTLARCLELSARQNPERLAADREVDAARARLSQARALEAPTLSVEAGKLGTPVSAEEREASLRLGQEIPLLGQRGKRRRLAEVELSIAEAERDGVLLRVRGEVTRAYRRAQAGELSLRTLRDLRTNVVDVEQFVQLRLSTGGARYLDVLRARAERARIENDVVESERALAEERRTLGVLLGRPEAGMPEPADTLAFTPLADSLEPMLAAALHDRPRVRTARLEVERARAAVGAERSGLLPTTGFSFGLDRVPGADRPGYGGEVSIDLPFMPWTGQGARVREAQAQQSSAESRLLVAQRSLDVSMRNAYQAASAASAQVERFQRILLADASDAIRAAVQNYQAGQIEALELFETLRTFRAIRLEYIRALLNHQLALTDLQVAE